MALQDFLILVAGKVQDTAAKLPLARSLEAITMAVAEYSRVRPMHKIATLTGDGITVTFAYPADYEPGFSSIATIEYPVGLQDPEFIDENEYGPYRDPATGVLKLRMKTLVFPTGATAYVDYTVRHVVQNSPAVGTPGADTVPVSDRAAVASLAASDCLTALSALYTQTSDPTLGADGINYRTKGDEYAARAKAQRAIYDRFFGTTDGLPAASARRDLDADLSSGAGDRFFHPRRFR